MPTEVSDVLGLRPLQKKPTASAIGTEWLEHRVSRQFMGIAILDQIRVVQGVQGPAESLANP